MQYDIFIKNFAKATDYMMTGYRFNEKWAVQAGKMCQFWGGYEFDANPMYIYQYSDMIDNLDSPKAGLVVMYKPVPTREFVAEVSNARNENLETTYPNITAQGIKDTRAPHFAGVEYYPDKTQDLHVSLSYIGQSFCYAKKSRMNGHSESRIELGMMYRIKCF